MHAESGVSIVFHVITFAFCGSHWSCQMKTWPLCLLTFQGVDAVEVHELVQVLCEIVAT
jgi:hypothetical protein